MNKTQLLKNLKENVYCKIGRSNIHGVGVIAIRDIPRGTDPFVGHHEEDYIVFTKEELKNIDDEVKKLIHDFFIIQGNKYLIPKSGLNGIDISYFMNHSNTPNIQTDAKGEQNYAICDIKKGEELTINYKKDYGEENVVNDYF